MLSHWFRQAFAVALLVLLPPAVMAADTGLFPAVERPPFTAGHFEGVQKAAARNWMYAFSGRDPAFKDRMTPDAQMANWSGVNRRSAEEIDAVKEMAGRMFTNGSVQYVDQYQDGDVIIAKRLSSAERVDGKGTYRNAYVEVFHMKGDKVAAYWEYLDTDAATDAGQFNFDRVNLRPAPSVGSTLSADRKKQIALEAVTALVNGTAAEKFFTAGPVFTSYTGEPLKGREAIATIQSALRGILSGAVHVKPAAQYVDGNTVISELDLTATTAKGEAYQRRYVTLIHFAGDKIAGVEGYGDVAYNKKMFGVVTAP